VGGLLVGVAGVVALAVSVVTGCSTRPCAEPAQEPPGDVALVASSAEAPCAKLVHRLTFEMGRLRESLEGFTVVRAPDAVRVYGMTETGEEAFDVASLRGKVTRIYRAPFLQDDRVLDAIARAAARVFLLRPDPGSPVSRGGEGWTVNEKGVTWCWAGSDCDLRWLEGPGFSACFMDWSRKRGLNAPERIHCHSEEGADPCDLTMKLVKASVLATPPPDATFEGR
jgi:hypothetical protein